MSNIYSKKGQEGKKQYATFNVLKIRTSGELAARSKHNSRDQNPANLPNSIDLSKIHLNTNGGGNAHLDITNRIAEINEIRKAAGAKKMRSNSVPAVELVLGASVEWFEEATEEQIDYWRLKNVEWAEEHYKDKGKLIRWDFHKDETGAPHLHLIFIPETMKIDKLSGKSVPTLSARDFQGGKAKMNADRSSQAEAMEELGLSRGTNNYLNQKQYEVEVEDYQAKLKEYEKLCERFIDDARISGLPVSTFLPEVKEPVEPVPPAKKKYDKKTKTLSKKAQEYADFQETMNGADNALKEEMWKRPKFRTLMVGLDIFPESYVPKKKKAGRTRNTGMNR